MADLINITREAVFKECAKLVVCIGKPGPLSYSVPSLINESENNLCPIQVESNQQYFVTFWFDLQYFASI